jgi:maleylacetoacetate isomerase
MQLYSFCHSSTSQRVRIALALKGLDYDYLAVNLRAGEQRSVEHLQRNPSGSVPVLVTEDGQELTQSLAIIDYLDRLYPTPQLIPSEPLARARVLEVANLIGADIHPLNNPKVLAYLSNTLQVSTAQRQAWYEHWVLLGLGAVEQLLAKHGKGPYCFGEQPSLADCCVLPQVTNALRNKVDLTPFKRVLAVTHYCQEQPEFARSAAIFQPDYVE